MKPTAAPPLPRKTGLPLHHQLFVVLRDQILRGLYPPGAAIPNEARLCELFGVSRITVRRAVADLEAEGLLEKRHGHGTFVRHELPAQRPAATLGFIDSLRKQAQNTEVQVLELLTGPAPAVVALQLQLAVGEAAIHAVRLRSAGGRPLMVTDAWVPEHLGKGITRAALRRQGLYEILMAQGVRFGRVVQEITALSADPHYARLLAVAVGSPLLRMTRLLYGADRQPVQHLTISVTPERSRILMDVSNESVNTLGAGQITHDAAGAGDM
ncbi:UTRA domain-containing protein [Xylophilus rhododendri]|uniref:UTRA domain-containing protein n=1 Tax=Xylophilus rhododendri TaxID=2697032 RepID=A0A857JBA9_9BURK|nr:GntR family transcriptional regulator [Xylophilus rhododendri]QHJ01305.1 UTRA domain-containing protein [Xylophilus rhododendri]